MMMPLILYISITFFFLNTVLGVTHSWIFKCGSDIKYAHMAMIEKIANKTIVVAF